MRGIILLTCAGCLILGSVSPAPAEQPGGEYAFGLSAGVFPIRGDLNAYRVGGEVGYRFTKEVAFVGEFAYAYATSSVDSIGQGFSILRDGTYRYAPINGSLLLMAPIRQRLSAYLGLGIGYYWLKNKDSRTVRMADEVEFYSHSDETRGFAPYFLVGVESSISDHAVIFGELKQIVGKAKFQEVQDGLSIEKEVPFQGPEIKIGIRSYYTLSIRNKGRKDFSFCLEPQ